MERRFRFRLALTLILLIPLLTPSGPEAGEPPEGPPWQTDYWAARSQALRSGQPIFIYFTKTY